MAATTPDSPSTTQRTVEALLAIALVLVLAWQLAYWTWQFAAPPGASAAPASASDVDMK